MDNFSDIMRAACDKIDEQEQTICELLEEIEALTEQNEYLKRLRGVPEIEPVQYPDDDENRVNLSGFDMVDTIDDGDVKYIVGYASQPGEIKLEDEEYPES